MSPTITVRQWRKVVVSAVQYSMAEIVVVLIPSYLALIEKHASKQSPTRIEELVDIFVHATRVSLASITRDVS